VNRDDPNAGWKGKGIWATYGTRTPFHTEGGKGTRRARYYIFSFALTHSRSKWDVIKSMSYQSDDRSN